MKGDSGTAIVAVIILVIAIAVLFIYFGGSGGLNIPGFIGAQPVVYSNDIIAVIDKFVSDNVPYEGQDTTIEFTVKNNGQGVAEGVKVMLDPPTGFTSSIRCGDKQSCIFDLDEGDAVDVMINLKAIEDVEQILPTDVRYSVSYPYNGSREIHIPITQNKNTLPRGQTFFVGDPTYGPVQISVTPPDPRPTSDGGTAVYAVSGPPATPFEMSFRVDNVGGGGFGTVKPVVMSGDDLKLTLTNLDIVFCDKIDAATKSLSIRSGTSQFGITGFQVPFEVKCTFKPTSTQELADGKMIIDFGYEYELVFSEKFSILPIGTDKEAAKEIIGPPASPESSSSTPAQPEFKSGDNIKGGDCEAGETYNGQLQGQPCSQTCVNGQWSTCT